MKKSKKRKVESENIGDMQPKETKRAKHAEDVFEGLDMSVFDSKPQSLWDLEEVELPKPAPLASFENELTRLKIASIEQKLQESLAFIQLLKYEFSEKPNIIVPYSEIVNELDKIKDLSSLWQILSGQLFFSQPVAMVQAPSQILWSVFQPSMPVNLNTIQPDNTNVTQVRR